MVLGIVLTLSVSGFAGTKKLSAAQAKTVVMASLKSVLPYAIYSGFPQRELISIDEKSVKYKSFDYVQRTINNMSFMVVPIKVTGTGTVRFYGVLNAQDIRKITVSYKVYGYLNETDELDYDIDVAGKNVISSEKVEGGDINKSGSKTNADKSDQVVNEEKLTPSGGANINKNNQIGGKDRFKSFDNETVFDAQTQLMWAAKDNGSDINWNDAKQYCESYKAGGFSDWRMPTQDELVTLYDATKSRPVKSRSNMNMHIATDLIDITCYRVWASNLSSVGFPQVFNFSEGKREGNFKIMSPSLRALPVRNHKQADSPQVKAPVALTSGDNSGAFSFPFMNKKITMGISPESLMKIFAGAQQVESDETEKEYSRILQFSINELDSLRFRFKGNRLVSVIINSNSTEGPGKEIAAFRKWLEKNHGKGKNVKSKNTATTITNWDIKGSKVIRDSYFGEESGDYNENYEINLIK